jgi:hypothetical protein
MATQVTEFHFKILSQEIISTMRTPGSKGTLTDAFL